LLKASIIILPALHVNAIISFIIKKINVIYNSQKRPGTVTADIAGALPIKFSDCPAIRTKRNKQKKACEVSLTGLPV
jgi:hypothetical protein